MSNAIDAADAIKKAAKQYEAFVAAAAILEQIGSLENATAEGQKALSAVRGEVEAVKVELSRLKVEAMAVQTEQAEIIANANDRASGILDAANAKAVAVVEQADITGFAIKEKARAEAAETTGRVAGDIAKLNQQRDALHIEVSTLNDRANVASEAADDAEKRLAKVKDTIAKMSAA